MDISLKRRTISYPPEFDLDFKQKILERDKHTCVVCEEKFEKLDVHHIDYSKRTVVTNCISVCRECHDFIHFEASWSLKQEIKHDLWDIAAKREGVESESRKRDAEPEYE